MHEHEENALLPLDLFSGLHEFINVQKKRKPYRGPCNDKWKGRKENKERNDKRAAKWIVGTFFVALRVKGTNENGSDGEWGKWIWPLVCAAGLVSGDHIGAFASSSFVDVGDF